MLHILDYTFYLAKLFPCHLKLSTVIPTTKNVSSYEKFSYLIAHPQRCIKLHCWHNKYAQSIISIHSTPTLLIFSCVFKWKYLQMITVQKIMEVKRKLMFPFSTESIFLMPLPPFEKRYS